MPDAALATGAATRATSPSRCRSTAHPGRLLGCAVPLNGSRALVPACLRLMVERSAEGLGDRPLGADGARARAAIPTFPGFPRSSSRRRTAHRRLCSATGGIGTAILDEARPAHLESGAPIVHTSADSVFQIAAHEDVVPVPLLYEWCQARVRDCRGAVRAGDCAAVCRDPGRSRTANRTTRDAPGRDAADALAARGHHVTAIGKSATCCGADHGNAPDDQRRARDGGARSVHGDAG
jgi:hypothetical protein